MKFDTTRILLWGEVFASVAVLAGVNAGCMST